MKKERLITNNKTLRLRTDRFGELIHPSMKPRQAGYIVGRIKANENLLRKCKRDKYNREELQKYL